MPGGGGMGPNEKFFDGKSTPVGVSLPAAATAVGWNQKSKDEIRRSVSKTYEDKDEAEGRGTPTEPHTLAGRPIKHNQCCAARPRDARGGPERAN